MISAKAFREFTAKWGEGTKTQRFGQAFLNTFGLACPHETNSGPCIFHERNNKTAMQWIQRNAIDWNEQ